MLTLRFSQCLYSILFFDTLHTCVLIAINGIRVEVVDIKTNYSDDLVDKVPQDVDDVVGEKDSESKVRRRTDPTRPTPKM